MKGRPTGRKKKANWSFFSMRAHVGWVVALIISVSGAGLRTYFLVQTLSSQYQTQQARIDAQADRVSNLQIDLSRVIQAQADAGHDRDRMQEAINKLREAQK